VQSCNAGECNLAMQGSAILQCRGVQSCNSRIFKFVGECNLAIGECNLAIGEYFLAILRENITKTLYRGVQSCNQYFLPNKKIGFKTDLLII